MKILIVDLTEIYGGGQRYVELLEKIFATHELTYFVGCKKLENGTRQLKLATDSGVFKLFMWLVTINKLVFQDKVDVVILNGARPIYLAPFIFCKNKIAINHSLLSLRSTWIKKSIAATLLNVGAFFSKYVILFTKIAKSDFIFINKKVRFIPIGIPTPILARKKSSEKNKMCVVSVTRLDKQKGIEGLLRAFAILSNKYPQQKVTFKIVGDGPLFDYCQKFVQNNALEQRIILTGYSSDVLSELANSDIFVLASENEYFPIVNLEAMSLGLPIVATRVGGIKAQIEDGMNGYLVEPLNAAALAEKIALILNNADIRKMLALESLNRFTEEYSLVLMKSRFDQLLAEI